jgi:hypothetical protein
MQIVKVTWADSASSPGWQSKQHDWHSCSNCCSVGFIIKRNKRELSIAQSWSDSGNVADVITIPMRSIKNIKKMED